MVLSMERWVGKVAVVTGVSAGIGAGIAELLVKEGVTVVGLARRVERVEELVKKLEKEKGKLIPLKTDISKTDDVTKAFKWIKQNVGPVAILINNAGIQPNTTIIEGEVDIWKQTFDTNVMGLLVATKEAFASMKENDIDGHIININSAGGHRVYPIPNINVYPATKFAVRAISEIVQNELNAVKSKVKVTNLSPGLVKTEILDAGNMSFLNFFEIMDSLSPLDVAESVVYVLSTAPHIQINELTISPVQRGTPNFPLGQ